MNETKTRSMLADLRNSYHRRADHRQADLACSPENSKTFITSLAILQLELDAWKKIQIKMQAIQMLQSTTI